MHKRIEQAFESLLSYAAITSAAGRGLSGAVEYSDISLVIKEKQFLTSPHICRLKAASIDVQTHTRPRNLSLN